MPPSVHYRGRLLSTFLLVVAFLAVEALAALFTNSLALLSDAGHMLTDAVALGMALAAIQLAARGARGQQTFGLYRLEILAALANSVLLLLLASYLLVEAVRRLQTPAEVLVGPMLAVAALGLAVNLVGMALLHSGSSANLNLHGAFLEVLADALASVGVIVAALVQHLTGWPFADPIFGGAIGLFILPRGWRLARQSLRILVQAAPPGFDLAQLATRLSALPDVVDVHDLHVWTLTSEMEVASVHLMVANDANTHAVLDQAHRLLEEVGIEHATLQVEPEDHHSCEEVTW
ncbi:MAG: cation diffusion facilitator family transporter [Actinomycetota bacterium]|nr:cation diffusion facilitator family transporter [Actinomycetota bacterium]